MAAIDDALAQGKAITGTEFGVSDWITVDQEMIDRFAECTFDDQWIHVDPERAARETPFGGTIAHGFLTLSLASKFARDCTAPYPGQAMAINYGFNKLRFLSPVRAGSRLRGRFALKDIRKRSDTDLLRVLALTIEIEGQDAPALVAEWLGLVVFSR
ncbi:nodulation protein NodN [Pseudooceanicola lipolyticus]|uniref:Nodulation protein NodN n=1 Tax=Pseudooceanicola lipolyticus TaxID=2029104 RepID=A0A2M8J1W8_9RHOB|nr:MaoC family dehydratase [Pseudooceanicola lipolyticus]PJE36780.1 nodulation protein NodN [Pseudooceanicola lipolyticus]